MCGSSGCNLWRNKPRAELKMTRLLLLIGLFVASLLRLLLSLSERQKKLFVFLFFPVTFKLICRPNVSTSEGRLLFTLKNSMKENILQFLQLLYNKITVLSAGNVQFASTETSTCQIICSVCFYVYVCVCVCVCVQVVSVYNSSMKQLVRMSGRSFQWPGGFPPPDIPECGFKNDKPSCVTRMHTNRHTYTHLFTLTHTHIFIFFNLELNLNFNHILIVITKIPTCAVNSPLQVRLQCIRWLP